MTTVRVELKDFPGRLKSDMEARTKRVKAALREAAELGADYVKTRVPVAFGELRDSVHARGTQIVADAPHAAPVETGSRPHVPPIAPLLRWVKLRFGGLRESEQKRIAWAVRAKIAKKGTRPHWYMRGSLPRIQGILDRQIRIALDDH